jgi:glucan 1,3-beta-glucosidase
MKDYRNINERSNIGDGVTDDTAAINAAISSGGRCGQGCGGSTTTPGSVYFPAGTYLISSSIIDLYYTNLIGNPNNKPILKATPGFSGFGLIDGDPYFTQDLNWGSTTVFWRQVRNFVLDMTAIPAGAAATGMHWPTAQATSIQNVEFRMSAASGTQHVGLFIESGMTFFGPIFNAFLWP